MKNLSGVFYRESRKEKSKLRVVGGACTRTPLPTGVIYRLLYFSRRDGYGSAPMVR